MLSIDKHADIMYEYLMRHTTYVNVPKDSHGCFSREIAMARLQAAACMLLAVLMYVGDLS